MDIEGKIVVVTGAASGIGKALCEAFHREGAKHVVCSDVNAEGAAATAADVGGTAITTDVSDEAQVDALVDRVEGEIGPIDIFWSNAGVARGGGMEVPTEGWQKVWEINVMSHVWAARKLVPLMTERGGGYLLNTASAAGLLNQIGSATYGVTKHAAVGLAEWLAITHGDQGIKVSVLCPQAVRTEMTRGHEDHVAAVDGMLEVEPVAQMCMEAIKDERFLILPHEQVADYIKLKAGDYDRWIGGMRKLNRKYGTLPPNG